jgi:glycosyltransferase involved in cell wall biosynthesis
VRPPRVGFERTARPGALPDPRPPRVGFERTALQLDRGGVARAARSLEAALAAREDVDLVGLEHRPRSARRRLRGLERELAWFPLALPRRARALGLDVLHCPAPLVPLRPPRGVALVATVYDALAVTRPEWFTRANALHQRLSAPALRRAHVVICASEHARGEVAAGYGIDPARIVVVPLGVDPAFTPGPAEDPLALGRPYVVAVGTLQPRKNLAAVLRALPLLDEDLDLVVVGAQGWGQPGVTPRDRRVVFAGRVDDAQLVRVLRGAACLVVPSLHEGFGLPVLEAMACGTPVACSRVTSLPEVAGDAAVLFDPHDPADLARAVRRTREEAGLLRERGLRRAEGFTWARCAEATVAAYRRALGA